MENRITIQLEGTDFAIALRRDDYLAYLTVTVDGRPANALPRNRQGEAFIVLTSPERTPELSLIRVAKGLADGPHTVEIVHRPAQGDDRWPIAGFAVAVAPDTATTDRALLACGVIGGLALLGLALTAWRLPWGQLAVPAPQTFRRFLEWLLSLLVSFSCCWARWSRGRGASRAAAPRPAGAGGNHPSRRDRRAVAAVCDHAGIAGCAVRAGLQPASCSA